MIIERRHDDVFTVTREVVFRVRGLKDAFVRAYGGTDEVAFAAENWSRYILRGSETQRILDVLGRMVEDFARAMAKDLHAVRGLSEQALNGVDTIVPMVEKPSRLSAQARHPVSIRLIEVFRDVDETLAELETLRWNGVRRSSDIEGELRGVKRSAAAIASWTGRVMMQLSRIHAAG